MVYAFWPPRGGVPKLNVAGSIPVARFSKGRPDVGTALDFPGKPSAIDRSPTLVPNSEKPPRGLEPRT